MSTIEFKKILCPTDFSEPSKRAVEYALAMGKSFGGKIIFVHVVEPVINSAIMGHAITMAAQLEDDLESQAKTHLKELAEKQGYDNYETQVLRGKGSIEILDIAKKLDVDLIILGTHGRSGISHFLIGSTAEKIVRSATCPVLTVKADTPPVKESE